MRDVSLIVFFTLALAGCASVGSNTMRPASGCTGEPCYDRECRDTSAVCAALIIAGYDMGFLYGVNDGRAQRDYRILGLRRRIANYVRQRVGR